MIFKEIRLLIPDTIIMGKLYKAYAETVVNSEIVINSDTFSTKVTKEKSEIDVICEAKLLVILIHEISHKKKRITMGNGSRKFETPIPIRKVVCNLDNLQITGFSN